MDREELLAIASELEKVASRLRKLAEPKKKKSKLREILDRRIPPTEPPKVFSDDDLDDDDGFPNYEAAQGFFSRRSDEEVIDPQPRQQRRSSHMDRMLNTVMTGPTPRTKLTPIQELEAKLNKAEKGDPVEFTPRDLVAAFQHAASEAGVRYGVNWPKDTGIMRNLMNEYKPEELFRVIDFLWSADRDYLLPKKSVGVGILTTGWFNRIYQDAEDWANGTYALRQKSSTGGKPREWSGDKKGDVSIGGLE